MVSKSWMMARFIDATCARGSRTTFTNSMSGYSCISSSA
jgi:hypothetical protein